jgi:hypothetical protein
VTGSGADWPRTGSDVTFWHLSNMSQGRGMSALRCNPDLTDGMREVTTGSTIWKPFNFSTMPGNEIENRPDDILTSVRLRTTT